MDGKTKAATSEASALTVEFLDLLLDEAERALLDVESRSDQPGRRVSFHEETTSPLEVGELRLAIAQLADAFPGVHYDLESIGDRLRNVGARAAAEELDSLPHVRHLVRLSLEVFFRQFPTEAIYEAAEHDRTDLDDEAVLPGEAYESYAQLLDILRARLN